ncbi:hypothetical protein [Roseateles sp.]|uniref:hypothetical protein n=1 Tax=Roseateles sp. TaxID=1971397 RepID=UPI002F3FB616
MSTDIPDLDALAALGQAATPPPWTVEHEGGCIIFGPNSSVAEADPADAVLIAAMRNNWTALLSALTAARAELDAFMHPRIQGDDMAARVTWLGDELTRVEAERDFWKRKRHSSATTPQADGDEPFDCAPECRCGTREPGTAAELERERKRPR